jgi:hypothetical protein
MRRWPRMSEQRDLNHLTAMARSTLSAGIMS